MTIIYYIIMILLYNKYKDIFQYIANNYLTYIEKLCLNEVIPININTFDEEVKKVFKKYRISYDNFKIKFNDNVMCFGGILLGILLNNIHNQSDIDLYHFKYENGIYYPIYQINVDTCPDSFKRKIKTYNKKSFDEY